MGGYYNPLAVLSQAMLNLGVAAFPDMLFEPTETRKPKWVRLDGAAWQPPCFRRSRGAQAHPKRKRNRIHVSRRSRRKHRRAA